MDTRTKVLTRSALQTLEPPRPLLVAMGRFEILRAELVRELSAALGRTGARSLLVVVWPFAGELAPVAARAEMAAALRVVDYVFVAENGNPASLPAGFEATEIMNLEEADAQRTRRLIEYVHSRHSA